MKKITLPKEILESIEYSFFIKEADLEILKTIMSKENKYNYDQEMFDYFYKLFQKNRTAFEIKMMEIAKEYGGEKCLNNKSEIKVDFLEGVMCIYE